MDSIISINDFYLSLAWLSFMLADIPRLFFRHFSKRKPFSTDHREKNYTAARIITQTFLQNVGYLLSLAILYYLYRKTILIIFIIIYLIIHVPRLIHQLIEKKAYVTTSLGHFMNDFIIKPFRMLILIIIAFDLQQIIWLLGFGIILTKAILTHYYEKIFDVPSWFHSILIICSFVIVISFFPRPLGKIDPDTMKSFLSTVAQVYAAYVGLLGVLITLMVDITGEDQHLRSYFTRGILLNYSCVSVLIIICIISLLTLTSEPINIIKENLFSMPRNFDRYLSFAIIYSLSLFLFFFTIMSAYVMLLHSGRFFPKDFQKISEIQKNKEGD